MNISNYKFTGGQALLCGCQVNGGARCLETLTELCNSLKLDSVLLHSFLSAFLSGEHFSHIASL